MSEQAKQQRISRRSPRRDDVIGVTSDGIKILKPPRGPRNLTDRQVRDIVKDLREAVAAARLDREKLPG
jgi:hypothetical protein